MACVEFITAFVIRRFEMRILGYELHLSPTMIETIDESLALAFESHYHGLVQVLEGFHLIDTEKVSVCIH